MVKQPYWWVTESKDEWKKEGPSLLQKQAVPERAWQRWINKLVIASLPSLSPYRNILHLTCNMGFSVALRLTTLSMYHYRIILMKDIIMSKKWQFITRETLWNEIRHERSFLVYKIASFLPPFMTLIWSGISAWAYLSNGFATHQAPKRGKNGDGSDTRATSFMSVQEKIQY